MTGPAADLIAALSKAGGVKLGGDNLTSGPAGPFCGQVHLVADDPNAATETGFHKIAATPGKVVVLIRTRDGARSRISMVKPEAKMDAAGNARLLNVTVSPDPGEVSMRTKDNQVFSGTRRKEGVYDFVMNPVNLGAYQVVFESQGRVIGKATIRVITRGLEEKDLGI